MTFSRVKYNNSYARTTSNYLNSFYTVFFILSFRLIFRAKVLFLSHEMDW